MQRPFEIAFNDLPAFVHHAGAYTKSGFLHAGLGYVSMETPVLYFYSRDAQEVSIALPHARFSITESFPNILHWDHVELTPGADEKSLPADLNPNNHYYAARETDAVPLRVKNGAGYDMEKFLFYRGVGSVTQPLTVRALGNGHFTLKNTAPAAVKKAFLITAQGGKVAFTPMDSIDAGQTKAVDAPAEFSTHDALVTALREALIADGLFEKEARAMIKTWENVWLGEEGTRVLYLLPRVVTDDWLPLEIAPSPSEVHRTMLGRIDVLTPEQERELDGIAAALSKAEEAQTKLSRFGRFGASALEAARERSKK